MKMKMNIIFIKVVVKKEQVNNNENYLIQFFKYNK